MIRRLTVALAASLAAVVIAPPASAAPPTLGRVPAGHDQAITVTTAAARNTTATLEVWSHSASGWRRVMGPWTAHVGYHGIAAAGAKREGDGRTPSGVFNLPWAFGVRANPGTSLTWRPVTGSSLVWDDDSASSRYNLWTDQRYAYAGRSPEPLRVRRRMTRPRSSPTTRRASRAWAARSSCTSPPVGRRPGASACRRRSSPRCCAG